MSQPSGAGDGLATAPVTDPRIDLASDPEPLPVSGQDNAQRRYDAAAVLMAQGLWFELASAVLLGGSDPELLREMSACHLRKAPRAQEAARRMSLENLGLDADDIEAILSTLSGQTTLQPQPQPVSGGRAVLMAPVVALETRR